MDDLGPTLGPLVILLGIGIFMAIGEAILNVINFGHESWKRRRR